PRAARVRRRCRRHVDRPRGRGDVADEHPGPRHLADHEHGRRRAQTKSPSSGSHGHRRARRSRFQQTDPRHPQTLLMKNSLTLEAAGRDVEITNPDKIFFPKRGYTKLDLANYYLAVADGALRGIYNRPIVLKRYVNGADAEPFFQKRAPEQHPDWIETVELKFPSGRTAKEIVVRDAAQLLWIINLGCIDLNPH